MAFDVLSRVKSDILSYSLLPYKIKILVGVSGGMDSVCLAFILKELSSYFKWEIIVAHFNHKQRGSISDKEALWVKEMASEWGLACESESLSQMSRTIRDENFLREQRYLFFRKMVKIYNVDAVCLGHHRDDQAETFLHRLIRGSHVKGLGGMSLKRPLTPNSEVQLVRPLLNISKKELKKYALKEKLSWNEDESNHSLDFTRNRIRHKLIPLLETFNPKVSYHLSEQAKLMKKFDKYLDQKYKNSERYSLLEGAEKFLFILSELADSICLDLRALKETEDLYIEKVFHEILTKMKPLYVEITRAHIREVHKIFRSSKSMIEVELLPKLWCFKSYDQMRFSHNKYTRFDSNTLLNRFVPVNLSGKTHWEEERIGLESCALSYEKIDLCDIKKCFPREIYCDFKKISGELKLSLASESDSFVPLGMNTFLTVKQFYEKQKIIHWERYKNYVIKDDEKIIWFCGYRMDNRVRCEEFTTQILHIKFYSLNKIKK
ncbi:tRNA lysidine(34) synthetase TilS [PVC group bacterium (ex Bugula neritina AB1)]|nr:tRNA lysidine(34) synthetase TilS [PVC group bacterium (ex Bugula neritina AB1)]